MGKGKKEPSRSLILDLRNAQIQIDVLNLNPNVGLHQCPWVSVTDWVPDTSRNVSSPSSVGEKPEIKVLVEKNLKTPGKDPPLPLLASGAC